MGRAVYEVYPDELERLIYKGTEEEKQKWKEYDLFCTTKIEEAKKLKYKDEYLKFNKKRNKQ